MKERCLGTKSSRLLDLQTKRQRKAPVRQVKAGASNVITRCMNANVESMRSIPFIIDISYFIFGLFSMLCVYLFHMLSFRRVNVPLMVAYYVTAKGKTISL